jgi:uncharacterized protein (DUF58 family)
VIGSLRLGAERPSHRPGPGPMPAALLRALDLEIRRRIDGLLAGDFRATRWGEGTELAQVRPYEVGDDVRQIEWNVTARTGETHVRVQVAERSMTAWLLLDSSPSMAFGTGERRKADVAEGVALALGHLATRRGNRLGIITFGSGVEAVMRPSQGRTGMLGLLTALRRETPTEGCGATSLGGVLGRAVGICRERSAVFVVSDWRGPRDWRRPLMQLAQRHEVVAIEVRDPREQALPDVGHLHLVDPETGRHMRVDTRDHRLRERFADAAAAERRDLERVLAATRTDHVALETSGDWLRKLAGFLSTRRARR